MEVKPRKPKVKKAVQIDPLDITESLGYKTYRKNGRNSWSKEDDEELKCLMNQVFKNLGYKNGIDDIKSIQESELVCSKVSWESIALQFKNNSRKPKDLRKRWTSSLDPNLKKGKWATEEDKLLMQAYEKHGPHWLSVAEEISGRTEDQCAKRYVEILGPSSEGRLRKWTLEEDLSLVSKVKLYGTRWRRISSELESRPSLTCRNRWRKIITSVVRGRAPPEIVKAVKEKQDMDLLNESLGVKLGTEKQTATETLGLVGAQDLKHLHYEDSPNNISPPGLQNLQTNTNMACSEKVGLYDKSSANVITLPSLEEESSSNGYVASQAAHTQQPQNDMLLTDTLRNKKNNLQSSTFSRSVSDKTSLPPAKNHSPLRTKSTLLEDSFFADRINPHTSLDDRHTEPSHSKVDVHQDAGKLSLPHAGQMEWKFTLKDGQGLSLSSGTVASSELVKELVDQARKYSLKISIHQHIHNHYGQQADSQNWQSSFPDNLNNLRTQSLVSPVSGAPFSQTNSELFNSTTEYRTFGATDQPGENDFLSQTPTYNVFGLDTSPQPDGSNLSNPANLFHRTHAQQISIQTMNLPPNNSGRLGTTSSTGSHSTPSDDIQDMGVNRVTHFNYLPPTVKPQLGSSDSTKATDLNKLLNPSPCNSVNSKKSKKHKKNTKIESGHNINLSRQVSANTSPAGQSSKHSKTNDTPGTAPSINEEEELDFWESLRSLAGGPGPDEESSNAHQRDEEDYHLFYGLFNSRIGHSDLEGAVESEKGNGHSDKDKNNAIPFNPS